MLYTMVAAGLLLLVAVAWGHVLGIVVCLLVEGFEWDIVKRESLGEQPALSFLLAGASAVPVGLWTDWFRRDGLDGTMLLVATLVGVFFVATAQQWLQRRGWDALVARARQAAERAEAAGHDPRRLAGLAAEAEKHHGLLRDRKRELRALEHELS